VTPLRPSLILLLLASLPLMSAAQAVPGLPPQAFGEEAVFSALVQGYPDQISRTAPFSDPPALVVGGKSFVWAEGRLLAPEAAAGWGRFSPQTFYGYTRQEPDVARWSAEQLAQAEGRLADRVSTSPRRDPGFFDELWDSRDLESSQRNQRQIRFLGMAVTVHRLIREPLARVEARLDEGRKTDPTLDTFLKNLSRLDGYNWRVIAGTESRSNHAYGTAIDVIPKRYGGKNPYWLWAPQGWDGWYRQAWSRRWSPHPALVAAFEAEGFVWGGKWLLFDTIHFEYRPEILVLNSLR